MLPHRQLAFSAAEAGAIAPERGGRECQVPHQLPVLRPRALASTWIAFCTSARDMYLRETKNPITKKSITTGPKRGTDQHDMESGGHIAQDRWYITVRAG